ncbi:GTP cyclohydrolase I FolE [Candidatus Dojkabacteria bacterium]|nr:GTP cyclohydrolase I FolE [Candidatus Dojkabacteria bacterium]
MEENIKKILESIGEDPAREGLIDTPKRVVNMYKELFSGYSADLSCVAKVFDSEGYEDMVTVKDIDFFSTCEHHIIPFFGKVHIAYIPNGKIIGLSKFGRIVEIFARRLQLQERLTNQIADFIEEKISPRGLIVAIEGTHLCMVMRGIKKINSRTITSIVRGNFKTEEVEKRREFFSSINFT